MSEVPVLVTYDIHLGTAHSAAAVERYLHTTMAVHERLGIPASFNFPAEAARKLAPAVRELLSCGHVIGNHGLTHGPGEIYDVLSPEVQEETLRRATAELEDVTQRPVRFFRAPVFRINGATIQALERLGYEAELSMNSQRLGLLSSDPWNVSWMLAPRRPYHPDLRRPWRRGVSRLWEIPLSCAAVPFMSNTMLIFGVRFMQAFFQTLCAESRFTGGPVTFMTHPEELEADRPAAERHRFGWKDLLPLTYGFGFRHALMETDPAAIARKSLRLLETMRAASDARFYTVPEFVRRLDGEPTAVPLTRSVAPVNALNPV